MDTKVAIFGASKGLGLQLANYFADKDFLVFNFSRTSHDNPKIFNCYCDVRRQKSIIKALYDANQVYDLVIYCPSLWENQEMVTAEELMKFMDTGPLGFQRVIHVLISKNFLKSSANVISIGSIASDNIDYSEHPSYALSKKLQDMLVKRAQIQNDSKCKITNIQLGTIGDDFVVLDDIVGAITLIMNLSQYATLTNMVLTSIKDVTK